jgi:hypothetical protein
MGFSVLLFKRSLLLMNNLMNKYYFYILGIVLAQFTAISHAHNCPDPQTTSLKWGVPPEPWKVSPYSQRPQGDAHTYFVRANILVAGYGQGVLCTYRNSGGDYSILWQVLTKIPAPIDYSWVETLGGFVCRQGLVKCQFFVA